MATHCLLSTPPAHRLLASRRPPPAHPCRRLPAGYCPTPARCRRRRCPPVARRPPAAAATAATLSTPWARRLHLLSTPPPRHPPPAPRLFTAAHWLRPLSVCRPLSTLAVAIIMRAVAATPRLSKNDSCP
ncbi:hypothetical protein GGX14DRAFT_577250 [Mycena pura]|uniref:Uncharacterized protein n=1 Tax=Mycena pura TaxID=153505 RepID=A0AAD6UWA0_9AGAR|nr:hypothetical protein GGX14DRAFT_577250 [Mycena pura]